MHEKLPEDAHVSCWSEVEANTFQLRGLNYLEDKQKFPSKPSACKLYRNDILTGIKAAAHRESDIVRRLVQSDPEGFYFIVHWKCGYKGQEVSCVHTYVRTLAIGQDPNFESLLHDFLHKDDTFRNNTLKFIPRIVKGNATLCSLIEMLGGTRPVIIGKKLTTTYEHFQNGIEVVVHVTSSYIARKVQDLFISGARGFVVDLAFLLEGQKPEHLPERIMGAGRMTNVDIPRAVAFADDPARDMDAESMVTPDSAMELFELNGSYAEIPAGAGNRGCLGGSHTKGTHAAMGGGTARLNSHSSVNLAGTDRQTSGSLVSLCIFCAGLVMGTVLPAFELYVRNALLGFSDVYHTTLSMSMGMWLSTLVFGIVMGVLLATSLRRA